MPYMTVAKENSGDIDLYYEDHGAGKPVILIHGYPLSGRPWEKQFPALLNAGHRVITYDRRGFGGAATNGNGCVSKVTLISGIPPFLLKTPANPEGVDGSVCEGIKKAVAADRPAFLAKFCADFHNVDLPGGTLVSDEAVQASWNISVAASPQGCLDCVDAWLTDLRGAGGPHGIAWTHADQVNSALLTFLAPEAKEN